MTYVYCLVRAGRKPALRQVPGGVPGAGPVRLLDVGSELWLVVADVDDAQYGEASIAAGLQDLEWVSPRAMGHEAVVERFLSADAVLPMQLFTIFKTDERAIEHVRKDRVRISRILRRIAGHVEWGVRLTWDEQAARAAVEKAHASRSRGASGGVAYLARKRDMLDVSRTQLAAAKAEATRAFRELSSRASDAVRRTSTEQAAPGSRLLLDAAYLVAAKKAAAFKAAVKQSAARLRAAGLTVSLTGPWPPYNFIR